MLLGIVAVKSTFI